MEIKVDKSEKFDWAIVVDEKDLRRLDETMKSALGPSSDEDETKLEYEITCSDGSKIVTKDVNEVVTEDNSKGRRIINVEISIRNSSYSKKIDISLGNKYQYRTVYYSITGDSRDWVYLTVSKIEERIRDVKQWYSVLFKIDSVWIAALVFFAIIFIIPDSFVERMKHVGEAYSINPDNIGNLIFFSIIVMVYITYKLGKIGFNFLFPEIVFRVGDGIKRHDTLINIRGKILWGILVAFLISIGSGVVLKFL